MALAQNIKQAKAVINPSLKTAGGENFEKLRPKMEVLEALWSKLRALEVFLNCKHKMEVLRGFEARWEAWTAGTVQ